MNTMIQNLINKVTINNREYVESLVDSTLVIDETPIEEADILLQECEIFLSQSKQNILSLPFQAFSRIRNWRQKRRGSKLYTVYESLVPRIRDSEKQLRMLLGDVVEKKNALKIQGRYLQVRLDSCIKFNQEKLIESSKPLDHLRFMVNKLSTESTFVKCMVSFNHEILRLKNIESVSKGKSFVPWPSRGAMSRPVTDNDLAADSDHTILVNKLNGLREVSKLYYL